LIAAATALAGTAAAIDYAHLGLALSHHDARAHLVVARRILDSLMPGWQQIGAVWLPLPHVLNMLPVQVDAWYRSGASGTAISIASMGLCAGAATSFVAGRTGSIAGGAAAAVLMMINPNVLYLQSTPMTEPVLFGTAMLAIASTAAWIDREAQASVPPPREALGRAGRGLGDGRRPGLALAAACMTRYEAWPICAAIALLSFAVLLRRGVPLPHAIARIASLVAYPAIAIVLFVLNSRWTTGYWFISSGFFVAENESLGHPAAAWDQVVEGVYRLSGSVTVWTAYAGAAGVAAALVFSRARASAGLALALAAAAALPWYAYFEGHPVRLRYGLPLIVAGALLTGTAIGLLPRLFRGAAAAAVVAATLWHASPLDRSALLIAESQRDAQNMAGRRAVTEYLRAHWDGRPIMMSMGSLAHYMHDLSREGFNIRDFVHEGNGEIWVSAFEYGPGAFVRWVAVEEKAEGGDAMYARTRQFPQLLAGFERVAEGGGVALYRRRPAIEH
jgi:hypothetical protein